MSKKYSSDTKLQKLFENFNKYLNEDMEMEMEDEMEDDSVLDDVLDSILDSSLSEGLLKEMFPTAEDAIEGEEIMNEVPPSKEEIKSDIKKALKAPEVKAVLDKIESSAKEKIADPSDPNHIKAGIEYAFKTHDLELMMAAGSIPGLSGLLAIMGSFSEPHHSIIHTFDQGSIDSMSRAAMHGGATFGAIMGAGFLAFAVMRFLNTARKKAKQRDNTSPEELERQDAYQAKLKAAQEERWEKRQYELSADADVERQKQQMIRRNKTKKFFGRK